MERIPVNSYGVWIGLSNEALPTQGIKDGEQALFVDTKVWHVFYGGQWYAQNGQIVV